jgi:nitrogen fixation NifU-like protein
MYNDAILKHFHEPSHQGPLPQASMIARVGSEMDGRILEMAITVEQDAIVTARFKAHGCPATIASAEWVATYLEGRSLQEAQNFQSAQLMASLQLPGHKHYCALMAEDLVKQLTTYDGEES